MATWKAAGMSYLQYVNACTTALRQIVKVRCRDDEQSGQERPDRGDDRAQSAG
jgi:hypothetical protein